MFNFLSKNSHIGRKLGLSSPGTFSPLNLFKNNEQGVWYDPSDFARYMTEKPELVVNGNFTEGLTGWIESSDSGGSTTIIGGELYVTNTTATARIYQNIPFVPGKRYVISWSQRGQTIPFYDNTGAASFGSFGAGENSFVLAANSSSNAISIRNFNTGTTAIISNLSIREMSDVPTMFQDSIGTTPVTRVEQPIGLLLDKSKNYVYGTERISNGTFETLTGWTQGAGTISVSGGRLVCTRAAGNIGRARFAFNCEIGKTYEIMLERYKGTCSSSQVSIAISETTVIGAILDNSTAVDGMWSGYFTATQTNHWIFLGTGGGVDGNFCEFDNVSIREHLGNHAFQATAVNRPILRNRYNMLIRTEEFNDGVYFRPVGSVTSNNATAPNGTITADTYTGTSVTSQFIIQQSVTTTVVAGQTYEASVYVRNASPNLQLVITRDGGGTYEESKVNIPVSSEWQRVTVSRTFANSHTGIGWRIWNNVTQDISIELWGASIVSSTHTSLPYQRVLTTSFYDSDTTKFPLYIACNGTNTSMNTNTINWSQSVGNNIITNGNFTSGMTGWRDFSDVGGSVSVISGALNITNTTATARADIPVAYEVGKTYTITWTQGGSATVQPVYFNTGSGTFGNFSAGNNSVTFVATASHTHFGMRNFQVGTVITLDDIEIRETTADEMSTFTSVRKLNQAEGQIFETSATQVSNAGTFQVRTNFNALANYFFGTRGSASAVLLTSPSNYAYPTTDIITTISKINTDNAIMRVDGVEVTSSTTDQGSGTYLNNILYLFARNNTNLWLNGNVHEIIIRGKLTDTNTIQKTEKYLAKKTKITL